MKTIYYDFSHFIDVIHDIRNNVNTNNLSELRRELNKFYKGSRCREVMYSKNTDNLFFGMYISPVVDNVDGIINNDEKYTITDYYLDIDSKLFEYSLGLTDKEILAVLLHEVGHMVSAEPVDNFRNILDMYLAKSKSEIGISSNGYKNRILNFALRDVMRKTISIFEKDQAEEINADEFVYKCGYGEELEQALLKIVKNRNSIINNRDNKLYMFVWSINLYKNIRLQRIPALRLLKKAKTLTGSKLQKRDFENLERDLKMIDLTNLNESFDDFKKMYNDRINRIKYKGVKGMKEDYYELALRAKNAELVDDAMIILRRINSNMAILQDYLDSKGLDDKTRNEVFSVLELYSGLRSKLIKQDLFKEKQIFNIIYPDINQKY